MTIARDTVAEHIKPLEGATTNRYTLGGTVAAGEVVALASTGYVVQARGTTVALAMVVGIAVQGGVSGDNIDVVTRGRVVCNTGGTVAALVYISDTLGVVSETAGTKTTIVGYNESATVLFVRIQIVSLS